jgi:hypothetical protein
MILLKKILEQKLPGEYNKVCKLTSVFDIMKLSTTIRINFDEAQQLITKACSSFGVVNPPKVIQARGRQEYQIFGKIFLRQPTTIHTTLHELAHYLLLGKQSSEVKKVINKKLLKMYYNVESIDELSEDDKKEAMIYATRLRFEPHGQSFVSKLDELLKWWKEYECKYKLSESINKPLPSQAIDDDIHWAVITNNEEYGYGVFSWHTDEFSAKYNAKVTGGYVILVEQDKYGCAELPKTDTINALKQYFGDDYTGEPPKPELKIVKESKFEIVELKDKWEIPISIEYANDPYEAISKIINGKIKVLSINRVGDDVITKFLEKDTGLKRVLIVRKIVSKESLAEMVMPREIDKSKIYYHGTKDKNSAIKIAKEGLKPQDIEFLEKKYVIPDNDEAGQEVDRQYMSISGRVYLTEDLFSAIQYASPGSGFELEGGNQAKGYVVVVNGNKIEDIEPDEDDVGSIILNIGNYVRSPRQYPLSFKIRAKHFIELHKIAIKYLGEEYWKKFFNEPQVGKIILPHLSDELKHTIIDIGGKIAHVGSIDVDEVWEFDVKDYYNLYSQDKKSRRSTIDEFVNNFFTKYARRIK